jgi:hypothetical protein
MARCARCDVRRGAAVFVRSDETICVAGNRLCLESFRRLLLQSGGANIARGSRLEAAAFLALSPTISASARSLVQDSGARSDDPGTAQRRHCANAMKLVFNRA